MLNVPYINNSIIVLFIYVLVILAPTLRFITVQGQDVIKPTFCLCTDVTNANVYICIQGRFCSKTGLTLPFVCLPRNMNRS